jgi:flagellar motor component MotA
MEVEEELTTPKRDDTDDYIGCLVYLAEKAKKEGTND